MLMNLIPQKLVAKKHWQVVRIDLRSPATRSAEPVVRLELDHGTRGPDSELAAAPSSLDALFAAVAQALDPGATLDAVHVSANRCLKGGLQTIALAAVTVGSGEKRIASATHHDLLSACAEAFIAAMSARPPCGAPCEEIDGARYHQVVGIDENDDLWLFASSDSGAAEAIAEEFRGDCFRTVQACGCASGTVASPDGSI